MLSRLQLALPTYVCLLIGLDLFAAIAVEAADEPKPESSRSGASSVEKHSDDQNIETGSSSEVHPLLPVIELATSELKRVDAELDEYSFLLIKRERIQGRLSARQYMDVKIRHRKLVAGEVKTPLSIYMKFRKPSSIAGREVLYVEGQRDDKLLARRGGAYLPNLTVELRPDGRIAMQDTMHPITDMGFRCLAQDLL